LLGRDLASLCRGNTKLRIVALERLKREADAGGILLMVSQMTEMERDDDLALRILVAIQRGFEFGDAAH
jgi:hypothetical protein